MSEFEWVPLMEMPDVGDEIQDESSGVRYLCERDYDGLLVLQNVNGGDRIAFDYTKPDWLIRRPVEQSGHSEQLLNAETVEQMAKISRNCGRNIGDPVSAPSHYTAGDIETIDFIRDKLTQEQFEGYCIGNVLKYVSRYRLKNGKEDLEKAGYYLDEAIEQYEED